MRVELRFAVALAGALCAPVSARAQSDAERGTARAEATEGVRALEAGRYADAIEHCSRAEAIMHAPTHLLLLARAYVKVGRLVKAQETYIKIKREELSAEAPRAFVDAKEKAMAEEAALAPRVPMLTVIVDGARAADVGVTLDGTAMQPALVGLPQPIDPGAHKLQARATDSESDVITVRVAEGAKDHVTLSLRPQMLATPEGNEPAASDRARPTPNGMPLGGWIALGIGATGMIAGTAFVLKNHSDRSDANALCSGARCPESTRADVTSLDSGANTAATLAWIGYGVGIAGLATGAVLFFMNRGNKSDATPTARVRPWFGPQSAGTLVTF